MVLVLITRVLLFPPSRQGSSICGSWCWFMECRKHECCSNLNLLYTIKNTKMELPTMLYSSLKARLCSPLCSVQFLIPPYLMTPLTNYNSGSHLFYGWAPKTFHFLVLQNSFFLLLDLTLTCSLAISLQSYFSHSLTDSLHKPFSCVISIILKNLYSPQ